MAEQTEININNVETNIPSLSSQSSKKKIYLIVAFLLISLIAVSFVAIYFWQKASNLTKDSQNLIDNKFTPTVSPISINKGKPVLIYGERISYTDVKDMLWPTYKISKIVGDSSPTVLIPEIGKVNENPSMFVLNRDKSKLLINSINKIDLLDLKTKEIKPVLNLEYGNYRGVNFSPDEKQLFVWDQGYGTSKEGFSVYTINLENGQKTLLNNFINTSGKTPQSLMVEAWRDDNKVVLGEPMGEGLGVWIYDFNSNTLEKKAETFGIMSLSKNGKLLALPNTIKNPCNEAYGFSIGSYELVDPVNMDVIDKIGDNKKVIGVMEISTDGTKLIYIEEEAIPASKVKNWEKDCPILEKEQTATAKYYLKEIGKEPVEIKDFLTIYKEWGVENIGAKWVFTPEENVLPVSGTHHIQIGSKKIIGSNPKNPLIIVAQYYEP